MSESISVPEDLKSYIKSIDSTEGHLVIQLGTEYDDGVVIVDKTKRFSTLERDLKKRLKGYSVSNQHVFEIFVLIQKSHKVLYPDNFISSSPPDTQIAEELELENNIVLDYEEWKSTLFDKFKCLKNTCENNFPQVWPTFEFALSVKNILHIFDITLPFAGIILGPPSSFKTLALEMLREIPLTFYTDSFTPKSFVSHNTNVTAEQLLKIDMLPKLKNKLFITPELAPIFSGKDEDLIQTLGIITRIMDGHGYESDSGAYGHRGYREDMMFTWIGASVDIPRKVYKHLGTLGPKLYFYRVPYCKRTNAEYIAELELNDFTQRRDEVKQKLKDYFDWFVRNPTKILEENGSTKLIKLKWDSSKDEHLIEHIVKLGNLLSHLRGVSVTWETRDTGGSDYGYTTPTIESPSRAMLSLMSLAKGHAILTGRNSLSIEDIPIVIKTVLSTAPLERVLIFELLLNMEGTLSRRQVEEFLRISKPTALKTMRELHVLGLVDFKEEDESYSRPSTISLKQEFQWFLSEEFKRLKEGYSPGSLEDSKNGNYNNEQIGVKKNYPRLDEDSSQFINDIPIDTSCLHTSVFAQSEDELSIYVNEFFEYIENTSTEESCKEKLPPPILCKTNNGDESRNLIPIDFKPDIPLFCNLTYADNNEDMNAV